MGRQFINPHVENCKGVFLVNPGLTNLNYLNVLYGYIATSGQNSGHGYISKTPDWPAVTFTNNYVESTPDAQIAGTTANVYGANNFGPGGNNTAPIALFNRVGSMTSTGTVTAQAGFTQAQHVAVNSSTFVNVGTVASVGSFLFRDANNGGSAQVPIGESNSISVTPIEAQRYSSPEHRQPRRFNSRTPSSSYKRRADPKEIQQLSYLPNYRRIINGRKKQESLTLRCCDFLASTSCATWRQPIF